MIFFTFIYFFIAFNSRDMTTLWVLNLCSRSIPIKLWKRIFKKMPQFFLCLKWPRKPQIVEYSTCVSCFNLEKTIRRTISCHKIQSVPIIVLKLLPIDSPDVGEPEKYPQLMLEVHTKWFRGSRTSLTLFWKILFLSTLKKSFDGHS